MPQKLETILAKVGEISNNDNKQVILEYYRYLISRDTSINYQRDNIKLLYMFANFIGESLTLYDIKNKETIVAFLDTKRKSKEEDSEQKWITTWNDYLWRLKMFYRWLCNVKMKKDIQPNYYDISNWTTPAFVTINKKKTKRLSPYNESEIWDREELLSIVKYEPYKRNKAILTLLFDFNARPHEITLMRIKNLRLKEKYGEGEVPYEAKTGSGPILLTFSFPYVRDWLNEHPFKNEPNPRLVCNLTTGGPVKPNAIWDMMRQLKKRIKRLLDNNEITDTIEQEKLKFLINTKKWNPYGIRHSSITHDSDYLPEYALKKKVRWSMNSKQGSRYIKRRMGDDLKKHILQRNGILLQHTDTKVKPSILNCPRCELVNTIENKYCSKCSYPLKPEAYDEIKSSEEKPIERLQEKYENDMKMLREDMNNQFSQTMLMIQQNPKLSYVKPEILEKINS
jgi:integrase/recombinase XerD